MWDGVRTLRLKLYDAQRGRLVSFSAVKSAAQMGAGPTALLD